MTKKIVALVLALILALSLCGTAMAVSTGEDANTAATDLLTALNIVKGMPDGSLELSRNVTRAEAAALMTRARLGEDGIAALTASQSSFKDVNTDFWAAKEIDYCAKNKIIAGDGLGNYFPNNNVTMNELMAISLRTLGYGDFVGADWEKQVDETASMLPTFSNLSRTSKPAVREDVFETIYQSLFTPRKAADGQTAGTLAEQHAVAVVKISDTQASFSIKGVKLDGVYGISAGDAFPAAAIKAVTYVPKEDGEICVLLSANEAEKTARLLLTSGQIQSVKTESDYSEISGSTDRFVAWNSNTKTITPLNGTSGRQDLVSSLNSLGGISLDEDVRFIIRTKDEDYERFLTISGIGRMPTIFEAEYVIYTATDGKQYIYIANGQNSTGYYCRGQFFIANPKDYALRAGDSSASNYYAVEGARNGEVGIIKFSDSFGDTFFADPSAVMPGLYLGVEYEGMRAVSIAVGQPCNPLLSEFANGAYSVGTNLPLKGLLYEDGYFYIATNDKFREDFGNQSSIRLKPESMDSKAFYFDIDSGGKVSMSIRRLSEVSEDREAYVWGTINSDGQLMNLYIVHSNWSDWNERIETRYTEAVIPDD